MPPKAKSRKRVVAKPKPTEKLSDDNAQLIENDASLEAEQSSNNPVTEVKVLKGPVLKKSTRLRKAPQDKELKEGGDKAPKKRVRQNKKKSDEVNQDMSDENDATLEAKQSSNNPVTEVKGPALKKSNKAKKAPEDKKPKEGGDTAPKKRVRQNKKKSDEVNVSDKLTEKKENESSEKEEDMVDEPVTEGNVNSTKGKQIRKKRSPKHTKIEKKVQSDEPKKTDRNQTEQVERGKKGSTDEPKAKMAKKEALKKQGQEADDSSDDFETEKHGRTDVKNTVGASSSSILQLKIVLRDISPPIWRRIQVLNNETFHSLHYYINEAMGWKSKHSHQFLSAGGNQNILITNTALECMDDISGRNAYKEETTKVSTFLAAEGDKLLYEYDFGDSWIHEIIVEKILLSPPPKAEYPKCTGGKRACPPEDCGGVTGYSLLLDVLKKPNHEKYQELIQEWLRKFYPEWHPEDFQKKKVFKKIKM